MSLIADGLLIAACLTMAAYCMVLSRRLRRLSSTEDGIGRQILQFDQALEETRAAMNELRDGSRRASERLSREIAQARKLSADLAALGARLDGASRPAGRATGGARDAAPDEAEDAGDAATHDDETGKLAGDVAGQVAEDVADVTPYDTADDASKDTSADLRFGFLPGAPAGTSTNEDGEVDAPGDATAPPPDAGDDAPAAGESGVLSVRRMAL